MTMSGSVRTAATLSAAAIAMGLAGGAADAQKAPSAPAVLQGRRRAARPGRRQRSHRSHAGAACGTGRNPAAPTDRRADHDQGVRRVGDLYGRPRGTYLRDQRQSVQDRRWRFDRQREVEMGQKRVEAGILEYAGKAYTDLGRR